MKIMERALFRRPRLLNHLHRLGLVNATSQTNDEELDALARHARGACLAVEIGSYQGVSSARIALALRENGTLLCVDPWPDQFGRPNPCRSIFMRHVERAGVAAKIKVLRGFSTDVQHLIPDQLDFAFIDGDHSWEGIEADWGLIASRMAIDGIVCLHDSIVPPEEPWRVFDSVTFYQQHIAAEPDFELIETVYSMAVLRRRQNTRE